MIRSALVVGTGLIGTSVGLALRRAGVAVQLLDRDPVALQRASDLGAGTRPGTGTCTGTGTGDHSGDGPADVAVVAVPPDAVAEMVGFVLRSGLAHCVTDAASVKRPVLAGVAAAGVDPALFVGGHPMAGRERSGPGAARADLFEGRPWVLTPTPATSGTTLERAEEVATRCGAVPVLMAAGEHDAAVALVSHVPHVVASLLAARLVDAPAEAVGLAGQGIRDVTRVAASDPVLWTAILAGNAAPVAEVLGHLRHDLDRVLAALASSAPAADRALPELLRRGNAGRHRLPGKHGSTAQPYTGVPVVVPDRPAQLARLFADVGDAGVNVEDVAIEHSPGQPVGLVELAVRPEVADELASALRARGWTVHR